MIVRDKPGPLQLLFAVRGSVLPHIWRELALVTLVAIAITACDRLMQPLAHTGAAPFAVFGTALSLFLGFRNNAAYDRWWEARKLWGGLLADSRSLAREAALFLPDPALRHRLLRLNRAFLHLHRAQLRKLRDDPLAEAMTAAVPCPSFATAPNPPCAALTEMNLLLAQARAAGGLDGFGAMTLSDRIAGLSLAQAGCERIAVTPLPYDVIANVIIPPGPSMALVRAAAEAAIERAAADLQIIGGVVTTDALIAAGRVPPISKFTLVSPAGDIAAAPDEAPWRRSTTINVTVAA